MGMAKGALEGNGKGVSYPMRSVNGVLISLPQAISTQVDEPLKSVTRGQCDARPTVTFPAAGHRRTLTGTKLYCLVTEANVCEQLAQGFYLKVEWLGLNLQCPNHYTTRPCTTLRLAAWRSGQRSSSMNEVNARRARLQLGLVTVFERVYHLGYTNQVNSALHPSGVA